jgi:hypothetical protein
MLEIPLLGNSFTSWQANYAQSWAIFNYLKKFRQNRSLLVLLSKDDWQRIGLSWQNVNNL